MSDGYIEIVNWRELQHYSKPHPAWIKLYHRVLDNHAYCHLNDQNKLLLVTLWMLSAKSDNKIPLDLEWIRRKGFLRKRPKLQQLIDADLIRVVYKESRPILENVYSQTEKRREETENIYIPPIVPPTGDATKKRKRKSVLSEKQQSQFDRWYMHYPRQEARGKAEESWGKHSFTEEQVNAMIATLDGWQTTEYLSRGEKFIPLPATYINQKRWLDKKHVRTGEVFNSDDHDDLPF